jgi:hypothetical protein
MVVAIPNRRPIRLPTLDIPIPIGASGDSFKIDEYLSLYLSD